MAPAYGGCQSPIRQRMRRQDTRGELAQPVTPWRSLHKARDSKDIQSISEHNCSYSDTIEQSCMPITSPEPSLPYI